MFLRVFDRRFLAGLAGGLSPRRGIQHVQRNHIHNGMPTNPKDIFHPLHLPVVFVVWLGCNFAQYRIDNKEKKLLLETKEKERRRRAEYIAEIKEKLESAKGSEEKRAYRDILHKHETEAEILDGRPIGS